MLVSYTLDAGLNRHNLDSLSEIHLGHKTISYKDVTGTGKNKLNFVFLVWLDDGRFRAGIYRYLTRPKTCVHTVYTGSLCVRWSAVRIGR